MSERTSPATAANQAEIEVSRLFDAPPEIVFKAWTEPERFVRWWGPATFSTPACTIDLRICGKLHFCMSSAETGAIWCGGVFREIVEPSRLVFSDYFADENGNPVPPAQYGLTPDWPAEALVTVTFESQAGGKTLLTLRHSAAGASEANRTGVGQGWSESFDCLADYLATL